MIKPTIGRVVWYKNPELSDQMCAAMITYVWNDEMVNLNAMNRDGQSMSMTSVPLFQGEAEACPDYQCCWMPYQKAQAEKHESEKGGD